MNYAILDYDGYICKSFYAAHEDLEKAIEILDSLTDAALEKAKDYFKSDDVKLIKILSGHSWKKELYTDYKKTREKNPYISILRAICEDADSGILHPESLEADELCIILHDYLVSTGNIPIIFSDDKDLRYASLVNCKINLGEKISLDYDEKYLYQQMLAGDKEDNIKGIPKVGMKVAEKLLDGNGYNIEGVIKSYKDKGIDIEECIKNINLIIPMKQIFNNKPNLFLECGREIIKDNELSEVMLKSLQEGQLSYITAKAKELYLWVKKLIKHRMLLNL